MHRKYQTGLQPACRTAPNVGTLRTLFALAVVFGHSWPSGIVFVGGRNAVQLFYVISGFLISYVLVEKKAYSKLRDFYANRYLRLYPIYFCVALLTFGAMLLLGIASSKPSSFWLVYENAPASADLLLILSNTFLFGQDWVMFSGVENNALVFARNFLQSEVVLYQGLIVPQAWTLGVELTFYLIAPLVLPRRKLIYLLLILSIGLRVYLINAGLGLKDPWTYRFFPTELALFLLGALSHQVLLPFYQKVLTRRLDMASNAATWLLIVLSIGFFLIPGKEVWKTLFLFAAFILLVPLAFLFQNRYRMDNWIGNLSYPVYIGHMFIILTCGFAMENMGIESKKVISVVCVMLTIGFAIGLNRWIGEPFEKIRCRIREAAKIPGVKASGSITGYGSTAFVIDKDDGAR